MYKQCLTGSGLIANVVVRTLDGAAIPFDPANTDYQSYLKWLAEGNTPLPAIEPVVEEPAPVVEAPVVAEPAVDEAPPAEPNEG
jgi:hypothetical protein